MSHFTVIMFTTICVLILPVSLLTAPSLGAFAAAYSSLRVLALVAVIALGCTLIAYSVMNIWQPHVSATEAGLIYCVEPLFASVFALFMPGWLSKFAAIDYANEHVTMNLVMGGGLITAANIFIQMEAMWRRRKLD
jgi:drug/metabolite transporter (DMT)-like permease